MLSSNKGPSPPREEFSRQVQTARKVKKKQTKHAFCLYASMGSRGLLVSLKLELGMLRMD